MEKTKECIMVGIGEILWDILPQGKQLGGAPANFAFHATQLGNYGVVVSSVGEDEDGFEILKILQKKNIPFVITPDKNYQTGRVSVIMDESGIPSYFIHEGVAWDHLKLESQHLEIARKADVVCYGTLAQRAPETAESIWQFISNTGPECIRLFDINLRQNYFTKETILKLLEVTTILKLNDEELLTIADFLHLFGAETNLLEQLCRSYNLDLIILTKGAYGSRLFSLEDGDSISQGYAVEIVDTVGAGDSFSAAVATGLCQGLSLKEIHPFAEKVAAFVCEHDGATPSLPPQEEFVSINR